MIVIKRVKNEYSITVIRKRLLAVCLAITFLFCFLCGRFFFVQIIWQEELNYRALDQWTREIPIVAQRGKITDRNGVVLADNTTAYTVYARSNAVTNKEQASVLLADALSISRTEIYQKLTKKKASEITLAKKVDKSNVEKLAQSYIDGIYYSRDNIRVYPKGETLCQVLGFTSSDNAGVTGVEKY